jgi:putative transposase
MFTGPPHSLRLSQLRFTSPFLRARATGTLAFGCFVVGTVWSAQLHVLFAIEVEARAVPFFVRLGTLTGPRVAQVARNLVSAREELGLVFRSLARDRDPKFTAAFDEVLASRTTRAAKCLVKAPEADCYAQGWVGLYDRWAPTTCSSSADATSKLSSAAV